MTFFERVPYDGISEFSLYSVTHIIVLLVSFSILYLFYKYSPLLKEYKYEKVVRYTIGILMLMASITIWTYAYKQGNPWYNYLPEATCGWAVYLGGISLLTKNRLLFILVFFWGWGAISTFLAPNIMDGPLRYNFYQFFLRHILILMSTIYMFRVFDFKVYKKDFKIYFYITISLAIIGGIISFIVNKPDQLNMFYMMQPAANTPILDTLNNYSNLLYMVVWLSLASIIGYLYGIPFYTKTKK